MKKNIKLTNDQHIELEKEFQKVFKEIEPQIQAKLKQAANLIDEAEALSEAHGIPFKPKVSLTAFSMSYLPESLEEKFPGLDSEFWRDITGAYGYEGYSGWQTSQTC